VCLLALIFNFVWFASFKVSIDLSISVLCYATLYTLFYTSLIATAVPKLLYFQSSLKRLVGGLKGQKSSRPCDISKLFKNKFFIPPPKVCWNPKFLFLRYLYVKQLWSSLFYWHLLSIVAPINWCLIICLPQSLPCYDNALIF
jgi:hypothetical protein